MHHFTVDVEEFFHASAMEPLFPSRVWDRQPRRSPDTMHRLLDELASRGIRGTFFVLGWLADREPDLVRRIASEGHEVASHGWDHRRVTHQTPEELRISLRRSKERLEELTGEGVIGFRAPSFSIVPGMEWAFDLLLEEGYRYDSSLFPVKQHPSYGYPCPPDPHWMTRPEGRLFEFPLTTRRWFGMTLPAAGGAYFRFFPSRLVHGALRQAEARNAPGTFYIHPWEFDPENPVPRAPRLTHLRMTLGTGRVWSRTLRLLSLFRFIPMRETFARAESATILAPAAGEA